jgi:predicted 3-demethylubiquinone-9 3-methyltransferase (glyoxalase superfamily)
VTKITPFLSFDDQAEEAVAFYLSVFPNSRILQVAVTERVVRDWPAR